MTMEETSSGKSTNSGNDGAGADASSSAGPALVLLNEAIHKVRHEVLPRIEGHVSGHAAAAELDFLKVKNETMITYLIELVAHVRREALLAAAEGGSARRRTRDDDGSRPNDGNGLMRLMEIKTAIDKTRNLEQKLRYQIDKLLVAADSHEQQGETSSGDHGGPGSFAVRNSSSSNVGTASAANDDPLEYRPNVGALLGDDDDDEDDDNDDDSAAAAGDRNDDQQEHESSDDDDDDDDGEDDEEIAAARRTLALAGRDGKAGQSRQGRDTTQGKDRRHGAGEEEAAQPPQQLYRAPRLASVPYAGDAVDRQAEKAKRERQRLRAGEIATALRSRYTDAPDVEDLHGGAELGRQRETSRKWAQKQQEKTQYEESNMVRLTETRKDKKFKKRLMRQEMSNLSAIADLGSLVVRGLGNGSGGGAGSDDDDDDDGGRGRRNKARQGRSNEDRDDSHRFSNGKRRRSEDGNGGGSNKNKKERGSSGFQSSNALQAALYGGGRDGGGKKKKRGGKR
jgi:U3 small nucleolar ribonucleoprotein protein LCP5